MSTSPQFAATPKLGLADLSVANTARDGTGSLQDVLTGGTNGTRITRARARAIQTTTAGMIRWFIYNGSSNRLLDELIVAAITVGSSTPGWFGESLVLPGFVVPSGFILRASTEKGELFKAWAEAADL